MAFNSNIIETQKNPDLPFTFHSLSYSASEDDDGVITELDYGTVDISATDGNSSEKAVALFMVDTPVRLKTWASGKLWAGTKITSRLVNALTVALSASANADPDIAGTRDANNTLTWGTGSSYRIISQLQITKADFLPFIPYNPTNDVMKYFAYLNVYLETEDYVQNLQIAHGNNNAIFGRLAQVEVNVVDPVTLMEYSIGTLENGVAVGETTNTIDNMIGYPKNRNDIIVESKDYQISGTLQTDDPDIDALFGDRTLNYDATNGFNANIQNNTTLIPKRKVIIRGWYTGDILVEFVFPKCAIYKTGDMNVNNEGTRVPIMIQPLPDIYNNNVIGTRYYGGSKGGLIRLPLKTTIATV